MFLDVLFGAFYTDCGVLLVMFKQTNKRLLLTYAHLKRGIEISSAQTWLNCLHKWTMWDVANGKISIAFRPVNYKIL